MIKRILNSRLPVIIYNPPKVFDLNWFLIASEAGALPVFDTEFFSTGKILEILHKLGNEKILFGIRLFPGNREILELLNRTRIINLDLVVLAYTEPAEIAAGTLTNPGYKVFIEVRDPELENLLEKADPHGLILKGHEAPGRVSPYTSFILMQWYLKNLHYPLFIHGGVGMHTASGMFAAGVCGIVLDNQLYLTDEAPLSSSFKQLIGTLEEKDTLVLGEDLKHSYRVFAKLGTKIVNTLKEKESSLLDAGGDVYDEIEKNFVPVNQEKADPLQSLFYLGQDAVFAAHFIKKSTRLTDVIYNLFTHIGNCLKEVDEHDPLTADSPLAREHGVKYPIIQGPMANVSDNADFAKQVFDNGALPFFALGNLPAHLAEKMLAEGKEKVPAFGAGMIGIETFNKTINRHLELVTNYKVKFALFAGGIPSQANALEESGTRTYLHVPSGSMLENAINNNVTGFVFEGTEAGGHIGNLTSLVLWELSVEKILSEAPERQKAFTMIFAGGIGTEYAAFFISGLTAGLAKLGIRIGISLGTPYLFTNEIIETKAIKQLYQDILLKNNRTFVIGKTVGLPSRTVDTRFSKKIMENEHRRISEKIPLEKRKTLFEDENLGSLLVAAKAFTPDFTQKGAKEPGYIYFSDKEHLDKGNFITGESLAFFSTPLSIKSIHDTLMLNKDLLFSHLNSLEVLSGGKNQINDEIAVIGMGCLFPDAPDCAQFWQNIFSKKYSITTMPEARLNTVMFYSQDRTAEDKTYSRIAGVIKDYEFDYARYGYTREEGNSISRSQQLILDAAMQAVENAGYLDKKKLPGQRTGVVIASCSTNELYNKLGWKYFYPELKYYLEQAPTFIALEDGQKEEIVKCLKNSLSGGLNNKTPLDSILNIEAARIAKHLGLSGINYCVDAACATSFAALDSAIQSLLAGEYDYMLTGGLNTNLSPETFIGFSKIHALSDQGSYPFDERADGFVLGEGAGMLVLKRMKDAIRDRDQILGIIKSVGGSSDGKGKAIAAPKSQGQEYAIRRCYENTAAAFSCNDIQYIEAHGTSTTVGDATEMETLSRIFTGNNPIGISSIKSQIGHLLGGAGIAGMIKVLLAIKNKTLPPNGQFTKLSPAIRLKSPLYILSDSREWEVPPGTSRKAGVSSYGFGGINYHCCVEEYTPFYRQLPRKIFPNPAYDFNDHRIVIIGMGCVLPGANNCTDFWNNLNASRQFAAPIPEHRFHNVYYTREKDPAFHLPPVKAGVINNYVFNSVKYKLPPSLLTTIDKTQLYALDAATQAIDQAGLQGKLQDGNKAAVILGNSMGGERVFDNIVKIRLNYISQEIMGLPGIHSVHKEAIIKEITGLLKQRYPANNEDTVPGFLSNIISGRIANFFNCNGANFTVDASSTSSAVAVSLGIKGLLCGNYDYVISGGSFSNLSPAQLVALNSIGLLSAGENRVFDKTSDGVNPAEGAALFILTTYGNAKKHDFNCYAEIRDFSFYSGINDHSLLVPEQSRYEAAIKTFFKSAPFISRQVNYLELCGLSNLNSDICENTAIRNSFTHPVFYGNLKPSIGYLFAANPAAVILKLILMNNHRTILPNWYQADATSLIQEKSILKTTAEPVVINKDSDFLMAMNFFSLGGNHAHGMLHNLPLWLAADSNNKPRLPVTEASFISTAVESQPIIKKETGKIVVLLSGQGAQEVGMMKDLYNFDEMIHFVMDEGDKIFKQIRGYSLLDIIFNNEQLLNLTINTQPAIFLSSAAIYNSLRSKSLKPDFFIGHSLGEFTALYCAGILDFKDALKLVIKRSDIMHHTAMSKPGSMVAIFKNAEHTRDLIQKSKLHFIYIANNNSDNQTVVSGENYKIELFIEFLKQENEPYRKINVSAAFHTPLFKTASRELAEYMETIQFNDADYSTVFSNVTGSPYPNNEKQVKKLLEKQMISTVEFVKLIKNVSLAGAEYFIEIGPKQMLSKLIDNIDVSYIINLPVVYPMYGEVKSLNKLIKTLGDLDIIQHHKTPQERMGFDILDKSYFNEMHLDETDFSQFISESRDQVNKLLYQEYLNYKKSKDEKQFEKLGIYTGDIMISGAAIGLPGSKHSVFNRNNFDEIITGTNYIEALSFAEKRKILDKNITRIKKEENGDAHLQELKSIDDVIQLSGHLGYFDLKKEYGIQYDYDITYSLAIAAGFEALKDANIPLVMQYKQTTTGSVLEEGLALPLEMQERTGIIFTSLFPGFESIINEVSKYHINKLSNKALSDLENFYAFLMENITDQELIQKIKGWYDRATHLKTETAKYEFSRNLLFNIMALGSTHFAQIIKAKGPNTQLNSTCASTTEAVSVAEDWIRANRCDRVIIISSDAPTSGVLNEWIGSSFLSIGAATNRKNVTEAALPFDNRRSGMILGSGAVSLIVEKKEEITKRGMNGQALIMGTYTGNCAYHASRIDAEHLSGAMKQFLNNLEKRYNLKSNLYARSLLFMSHEAYTPSQGGTAEAEIAALKNVFPKDYQNITITNIKGYTGNTLGASIEDAVLVKSLQKQRAPAIANLKEIPEHFKEIKFSTGRINHYEYGMHMAAGLGSQFALLFLKRVEENLVEGNVQYQKWLSSIANLEAPKLKIKKHILQVESKPVFQNDPGENPRPQPTEHPPIIHNIKEIIARQTGYAVNMLEENLDFEADLGIDTVKQVQIFGKVSNDFGFKVPDDLKLNKLNTINKLAHYVEQAQPAKHQDESSNNTDNTVKQKIKNVISSQTGYTSDILDDNLDFEADLGIDTVKQVQIFGKVSSDFGFKVPDDLKLNKMNTITKLEEFVKERMHASGKNQAGTATEKNTTPVKTDIPGQGNQKSDHRPGSGSIKRYIIEVQETALPENQNNIFNNRTFLVSADNYGFAPELIKKIKQKKGKVITIGVNPSCDFQLDVSAAVDPEAQVKGITDQLPELHGFIHLLPLDFYFQKEDLSEEAIRLSLKFFFLMIKNLYNQLEKKECLLTILSLNSLIFPYTENPSRNYPLFAGLAGMLKTVQKELPHAFVKAVDFYEEKPLSAIKEIIQVYLKELMSGDTCPETGYRNCKKYILAFKPKDIIPGSSTIKDGDTILVAGGARGITFEIMKALTAKYKIRLIILGRSEILNINQKYGIEMLKADNEQSIMLHLQARMKNAKPLAIKKAAQEILNANHTLNNIQFLKSNGSDVEYYALDVKDSQALKNMIDESVIDASVIIDGILFAAGIEESEFIHKKTLSSFNRVFDTKVTGILNLLNALEGVNFKYLFAFSSVTARFGNAAQADYTAANDMLGKIIQREKMYHPERMYKILDWTAWEEVGMAARSSAQKVLAERGVAFLPLQMGIDFFIKEIYEQSTIEVLFTGASREGAQPDFGISRKYRDFSFLDNLLTNKDGTMVFNRILDINHDLFLKHHVRNEVPLFLGATGIEAMAQAAVAFMNDQFAGKQFTITEIRDFSIPYGIKILKNKPREIFIEAEKNNTGKNNMIMQCKITSLFKDINGNIVGEPKEHYYGQYYLKELHEAYINPAPEIPVPQYTPLKFKKNLKDLLYHPERLFMDDLFISIKEIFYYAPDQLITKIHNTEEKQFFADKSAYNFITDIILVDAVFQTCGALELLTTDNIVLPSQIFCIRFYKKPDPNQECICITKKVKDGNTVNEYTINLTDPEGNPIMYIEKFTMVKLGKCPKEYTIRDKIEFL